MRAGENTLLSNHNGKPNNRSLDKVRRPGEEVIVALLFFAASLAVIVSVLIIYTLLDGSLKFFAEASLWEFLTTSKWIATGPNKTFGVWPLLAGTLLIAGGSILIAAPIGIGGALYLSEFAPKRVRDLFKPVIEILAGIPSIVYGFFALLVISPLIRDWFGADYFNAASAILVVSVMILPIIMSISDDAMNSVPRHLREASRAMGATEWETATRIVLPSARSGITASVLLGVARAIGETMAVVLAAGSLPSTHLNPLRETQTMTAFIAQMAGGEIPQGELGYQAGFAVGLTLFIITYAINLTALYVVKQRVRSSHSKIRLTGPVAPLRSRLGPVVSGIGNLVDRLRTLTGPRGADYAALYRSRKRRERFGRRALMACLVYALLFLLVLLLEVANRGLTHIDGDFLTAFPSGRPHRAGIGPVIMGSVYLMGLTLLFVLPAGVGAAVYLVEFAPDRWYTRRLRDVIQNLAGVPSIIFGLVGLIIFAELLGMGASLMTGALTLAFMTLPMVVVTTEEALKTVPVGFREASWALGATRWQTVRHHVLPNAIPGIVTGAILSLSRAIGETAPILFVVSVFGKTAPGGPLDGFMALPMQIFYWTTQPQQSFQDLAAATIVILLGILLLMNTVAVFIRMRAEARRNW